MTLDPKRHLVKGDPRSALVCYRSGWTHRKLASEVASDRAGGGRRLEAWVAVMLERSRALRAEVDTGRGY
jgi:hypothetical protein